MIEVWKLTRELKRLTQQISILPEALYEPFKKWKHDRAFDKGFPEHAGTTELRSKIAIILIWQPNGISPSTIDSFRHFHANGYSVLVVSNAALSENDVVSVKPYVWKIIERPNFGYDFGGYRDGIKFLNKHNIKPDFLVIMNDSIWYPVWPGDDTLAKMERSTTDLTGMILRNRRGVSHLESYFYMIKGHALKDTHFNKYWKEYRLTSNKYKVIRRGERGFSVSMQAAGLTISGLFSQHSFKELVMAADTEVLRKAIDFSALPSIKHASAAKDLVLMGSKEDLQIFIEKSLEKLQFYSAFPIISHNIMKFPILKRSSDAVAVVWRRAVIRAIKEGIVDKPISTVIHEMNILPDFQDHKE